MLDTKMFIDFLVLNGINKIAGVPCSYLCPLINEAENRGIYEPFTNEGDALAYAAGASLAGQKCAVVMQNSGLSNAISPLTSLNELFGLHVLLIIGNRGADDEPQHSIVAKAVKPMLNVLNIPYFDAEEDNAAQKAIDKLKCQSAAILVNSGNTFSTVEVNINKIKTVTARPLRREILEIISQCSNNTIIVTTTGFTSREMFCIKDRALNFYMVGSMGCLSSLALGISECLPDKRIIAIDGDSSCLMRLGALYTLTQKQPKNLCYIVLDNEANESTGGQRNSLGESRLLNIINSFYDTKQAHSPNDFQELLHNFRKSKSYTQIYSKIRQGTLNELPRPDRKLIFDQADRFKNAMLK